MKNSKKFYIGSLVLVIILTKLSWNKYMVYEDRFADEEKHFQIKQTNNTIYIPTIYRDDCKVMSIDSLKNFSSFHNYNNGIAKLLHYVTNEEDIARVHAELYKKCGIINTDMRIVHWTDASFFRVLVTQFDKKTVNNWKTLFSKLDDPARTTIIRSMVLLIFGGVSLSLETACLRPMKEAMTDDPCFLSIGNKMRAQIEFNRDFDIGESVIGCRRDHQLMNALVKNTFKLNIDRFYLTETFLQYNRTHLKREKVAILDANIAEEVFPKPEMEKMCPNKTEAVKRDTACKLLKGYKPVVAPKPVLKHLPLYGISNIQIVASDVCMMGFPVHIVII